MTMKFEKAAFLLLITSSFYCNATEISCTGTITSLMADHSKCTDNNGKKQLAFKITGSNYWLCNDSDTASSVTLSAKIAEKPLEIYINNDNGETCEIHPHYLKPNYTILR